MSNPGAFAHLLRHTMVENMGKVLGALPALDFLPLVYLLTCVTVVKSSARAAEYSD